MNKVESAPSGLTCAQITYAIIIVSSGYILGSGIGLPGPFLPKLNEQHGLSSELTGWMMSTYCIAHLAVLPFISKYLSKLGLYEMACWGTLLLSLCTVLFGLLEYVPSRSFGEFDWPYVILVFMIRACFGASCSTVMNACMTINSLAFPGYTTIVMGLFDGITVFGTTSSPAVAAGLYKLGGFMLVFVGYGSCGVIISIFMFIFLPRDLQVVETSDKPASLKSILSKPRVTGALVLMILEGIIWSGYEPILEPELRNKFGLSQENAALCFITFASVYAIASLFVSKLLNDGLCIDAVLLMGIAAFISVIAYLLAGPAPFIPGFQRPLWLLLCNIGILGGMCGILTISTLNETYIDREKCSVSTNSLKAGLWLASYDIGGLLGPAISGSVTRATNFAWASTCLAGISFLFFGVAMSIYCVTKGFAKRCMNRFSVTCNDLPLYAGARIYNKGYESI